MTAIIEKVRFVRDHLEIECGDVLYRIDVVEIGCEECLIINKQQFGNGRGEILIQPKVSNEIMVV